MVSLDLLKKKATEANKQYWFGDMQDNIHNICNLPTEPVQQRQELNWDAILRALTQQRTFVNLNITLDQIPYLIAIMLQTTYLQQQKQNFWTWWHYTICQMICLIDWFLYK